MAGKPNLNSPSAQKELDKVEEQFDVQEQEIKSLNLDRVLPSKENYPEHQISSKEIEKSPDIYIKPKRSFPSREKFNEKFRDQYNRAKEYVHYTVQHEEIKGENVDFWTKPFPGVPAEEWSIPSGKAVWIPRYVADHLENNCTYHRLRTQDRPTSVEGGMTYFGSMVVDELIYRISARPVSTRRTISMGSR